MTDTPKGQPQPQESVQGSGHFNKSTDSLDVPPPPIVNKPPTRSSDGNDGGDTITTLFDDFSD